MRQKFFAVCFFVVHFGVSVVCCAEEGQQQLPPQDASYTIVTDDLLEVSVADHPELSATATVIADGTAILPLLGPVKLQGMTVDQATQQIKDLYDQKYIVNPVVSVQLRKSKPKQFYIYGEIKIPGVYPIQDGLTTLKAVVIAGGFTDFAARNKVKILRQVDGKDKVIRVNVDRIAKVGDTKNDVQILPDDVIVIPEALF